MKNALNKINEIKAEYILEIENFKKLQKIESDTMLVEEIENILYKKYVGEYLKYNPMMADEIKNEPQLKDTHLKTIKDIFMKKNIYLEIIELKKNIDVMFENINKNSIYSINHNKIEIKETPKNVETLLSFNVKDVEKLNELKIHSKRGEMVKKYVDLLLEIKEQDDALFNNIFHNQHQIKQKVGFYPNPEDKEWILFINKIWYK